MSLFKTLAMKMLREAEEEVEKEPGSDSLDAQVDKYLADYESEAKNSKNEGRSFRSLTRRFLLEAGEDEEEGGDEGEGDDEEEPEGDEEDSEGGDEEGGDEGDDEEEEEEKLTSEDINIENFAASVMRLIDNYDSLLEVRSTVLRRTVNFLSKNYDKDVVDSFKEGLVESYGVEIGKTDSEMEDEEFEAPGADRAGASPGGA